MECFALAISNVICRMRTWICAAGVIDRLDDRSDSKDHRQPS
jgi:hypothetical protein